MSLPPFLCQPPLQLIRFTTSDPSPETIKDPHSYSGIPFSLGLQYLAKLSMYPMAFFDISLLLHLFARFMIPNFSFHIFYLLLCVELRRSRRFRVDVSWPLRLYFASS